MKNKNKFEHLYKDILGGITSGVVAIPLALAFGVASGLGPLAGLYGAIILCFVAALFGGAKPQISGPTGPMTVILAATVALYPNNPEAIFTIIVMAGLVQVALAFMKVGGVVKYVPYPVISGFLSGIGCIIILLQLNPFLGAEVIGSPVGSVMSYIGNIPNYDIQSAFLGFLTLGIVFFTPSRITNIIPAPLLALVVGTLTAIFLNFEVDKIGAIDSALPSLAISGIDFSQIHDYIPIAVTLGVIGAVDSLLTALVVDSLTREKHNADRVLLGQGIGNALTGMFGGVIGAGATMRTVVNIKAGGATRLSAIIHAIFLAVLLLGAAPLVQSVPMAVLAGILIKVGSDIIDFKFIRVIKYAPKHDLYVMILVFVLTVFYDLIFAVGAGITLAALLFARQVTRQTKVNITEVNDSEIIEMENEIEQASDHKIRIVHIDGVLFFGTINHILSRVEEQMGTKYLILNFESIPLLDISAVFALEDIIVNLKSHGIKVLVVLKCKDLEEQLSSLGIIEKVQEKNVFYEEIDAIEKAKNKLKLKVCLDYIQHKVDNNVNIEDIHLPDACKPNAKHL